jgi:hypothetical protein
VMPKMSGIQLAKSVIKERPAACVLLMSGSFEGVNPGFPVLRKPCGTTKLSDTVKGLLPVCQKPRKRA